MSPLGIRRPRPTAPLRVRTPRALLDVLHDGPAPLLPGADPDAPLLTIAFVVPAGRRSAGAQRHLASLAPAIAARGHEVSIVLEEDQGAGERTDSAVPVVAGVDRIADADVVVAVGTTAVPAVLAFPRARARALLLLDDEREQHGASAARLWTGWALERGLHAVCASSWVAASVPGSVTTYEPGIDQDVFRPLPTHRRDDLVLAYAPPDAPWRAAPIVLLAMEELRRRRPGVEVALFGSERPVASNVPHRQLGRLDRDALAHAYASATVGLVLSLTAPSLVGAEMLACGLSVVEALGPPTLAAYGSDGPVELRAPDPLELCAGVERLLDDLALRAERARAGMAFVGGRTWGRAAQQVETGLREALRDAADG